MKPQQAAMPDEATLKKANVNPVTGLATDYLNVFNEYIMLAELVADGSMEGDVLAEWQPIDYESHFLHSGFAGVKTVLAAYRALNDAARNQFENEVNLMIDQILAHQHQTPASPNMIGNMQRQRDSVAALISGPALCKAVASESTQAAIDALFD